MTEMAHAGKHHGDAGFIGGIDHVLVAHGSTRLTTAVAPASIADSSPSANGKKASEATTLPLVSGAVQPQHFGRVDGLACSDPGGINPAHLPRADADGGAVERIDDGVRLDMLGHPEGKAISASSRASGARLVTTLKSSGSTMPLSRPCTSRPPATDLTVSPGWRGSARPPVTINRRFFLADRISRRFLAGVRGNDDFGEHLDDFRRRLRVERAG
jgi:hypothetical protein